LLAAFSVKEDGVHLKAVANHDAVETERNVSPSPKDLADKALRLVAQAAELVCDAERSAAEKTARAEALVDRAAEQLKTVHARLRSSELRKTELEAEVEKLTDLRVQASLKIQELDEKTEQMEQRLMEAEAKLAASQQREVASENAIKYIEDAIQTRLLQHLQAKIFNNVGKAAECAA
jgi:chromosome segregation ATPase